jgi:uncharacterized membrane protein
MKTWQFAVLALVIALGVAWASNRGMIPYVNAGKKLAA